jgi:hypothetical protein
VAGGDTLGEYYDIRRRNALNTGTPSAYTDPPQLDPATDVSGGSLTDGGTYYWVVTATTAAGETAASNQTSLTVAAPNQKARLTWSAVSGATGYKVYRTQTSNVYASPSLVTTTSSGTLTYDDAGTASTAGNPGVSTAVLARALSDVPPFGVVGVNEVDADGIAQVGPVLVDGQLGYVNGVQTMFQGGYGVVSGDFPNYVLFESGDGTPQPGEVWGPGPSDAPTLAVPTASAGGSLTNTQVYYWVVTAVTALGETTASNRVTLTVAAPNRTAHLSWSAVVGATGYRVYRSTTTSFSDPALVASTSLLALTDNGSALSAGAPPAINGAGSYKIRKGKLGFVVLGNASLITGLVEVDRTPGANTLRLRLDAQAVGAAAPSAVFSGTELLADSDDGLRLSQPVANTIRLDVAAATWTLDGKLTAATQYVGGTKVFNSTAYVYGGVYAGLGVWTDRAVTFATLDGSGDPDHFLDVVDDYGSIAAADDITVFVANTTPLIFFDGTIIFYGGGGGAVETAARGLQSTALEPDDPALTRAGRTALLTGGETNTLETKGHWVRWPGTYHCEDFVNANPGTLGGWLEMVWNPQVQLLPGFSHAISQDGFYILEPDADGNPQRVTYLRFTGGLMTGYTVASDDGGSGYGGGGGGGGGSISRIDLGFAAAVGTAAGTSADMTVHVVAGMKVIVNVGTVLLTGDAPGSLTVTLDGSALALDADSSAVDFGDYTLRSTIHSITAAATGSFTLHVGGDATAHSAHGMLLFAFVVEADHLLHNTLDLTVSASGSSSVPDCGTSGATSLPAEYVQANFLIKNPPADAAWQNGFSAGSAQAATFPGTVDRFTFDEGYRILSAPTTYDPALTASEAEWVGAGGSYQ